MKDNTIGQLALSEIEKDLKPQPLIFNIDIEPPLAPKSNTKDIIFSSSNVFGIPDLLIEYQCKELILPCFPYRKVALNKQQGCLHFYIDDYRFDPSIWVDPDKIKKTKVTAIIEPNYTLSLDSPVAWVIWSIYKKRWLARYWQQQGYNIIVDLNVPPEFYPISLLGVPHGWKAYATRGYPGRIEALFNEYELAIRHADSHNIFFLVYGGGRKIWSLCKDNGWNWLADEESRSKGVIYE